MNSLSFLICRMSRSNSGTCPQCGHENGVKIGPFVCESCRSMIDESEYQRLTHPTSRQWLRLFCGGLLVAGGIYGFHLATMDVG